MGDKKENIKNLFNNSRTRIIVFLTLAILLVAIFTGVYRMQTGVALKDTAIVEYNAKGIQSIPGAQNPTSQYLGLQKSENASNATAALHEGGSTIPTILSSQTFGNGIEQVGDTNGEGSLGFNSLAKNINDNSHLGLWTQTLRQANCNNVAIQKVMKQGASLTDIISACSCSQLKNAGFKLDELKEVCSCKGLKAAGYDANQLKENGYSTLSLKMCGFYACELKSAGFLASELKNAGFSDGELKGAGFSIDEINDSNQLPDWMSEQDVRKAGCGVAALKKLKEQGVTASAIRRISGCDLEQFRAAGFSAKDLNNAGFSAAELLNAGFSPDALRRAGFTATEMRNAGLTPEELLQANYSQSDVLTANSTLPPGITPEQVKSAGCDKAELENLRSAGVSISAIKKYSDCSNKQFTQAGFTPKELSLAGLTSPNLKSVYEGSLPSNITERDILKAGCSPDAIRALIKKGVSIEAIRTISVCHVDALRLAGVAASELMELGVSDEALARAGFTPEDIKAGKYNLPSGVSFNEVKEAGCTVEALKRLKNRGVSAKSIKEISGCNAKALKNAGFSAIALKEAGFSDQQLSEAGFSSAEINSANFPTQLPPGISLSDIKAAGCSVDALKQLKKQGVSAAVIKKQNGCNASQLKQAGYNALDLTKAGFSPTNLAKAGFSNSDIEAAKLGLTLPLGISVADIKNAGCSPAELKKLKEKGVSAKAIKKISGCNAKALKNAGFSPRDLKEAGFSDNQLSDAGFSSNEISAANLPTELPGGITLNDIRAAGCSVEALRQLKNQGVSAAIIKKQNGCTASQLKEAGYNALDLVNGGFSSGDLAKAGFTNSDIQAAKLGLNLPRGVSVTDIKNAGCSTAELQKLRAKGISAKAIRKISGCNAAALKKAGFSANDLKQAGFSDSELVKAGYSALDLKKSGLDDAQLKALGFSKKEIKAANLAIKLPEGISVADIKNAGCSPKALIDLRNKGVSAELIKQISGCSAAQMKAGGYLASALKKAGFSYQDLKSAGFSEDQIKAANLGVNLPTNMSFSDIKSAGCSPEGLRSLKDRGLSAKAILKISGCSPSKLKAAGFSAAELMQAGLNSFQLSSAGFTPLDIKKAREDLPPGISLADIKKAGCSIEAISKLRDKGVSAALIRKVSGCNASTFKAAGYGATALKNAGFNDKQLLDAGFSIDELKASRYGLPKGISVKDIKEAGCHPGALARLKASGVTAKMIKKISGCSAEELKKSGFDLAELMDAGFNENELINAGFSSDDIESGKIHLPSGISVSDLSNANCNPELLRELRKKGVSAAMVVKMSHCSANTLREAGYSPAELLNAGLTKEQLLGAGFSATQLKNAGFTDQELKEAGFSKQAIRDANIESDLPIGVTRSDIKKAGCSLEALTRLKDKGVSALAIRKISNCSVNQLKAAGYNASDLAASGFTYQDLSLAGFTPHDIKAGLLGLNLPSGITFDDVQKAGCSPELLRKLKAKGLTAKAIIKVSGCSPKTLKEAGFDAASLKDAGFSDNQLKKALYSDDAIKNAKMRLPNGVTRDDIIKAGCSPEALRKLRLKGVSALLIRETSGCSVQQLKASGFSASALKEAGFTDSQLTDGGYSSDELQAANLGLPVGVSMSDIVDAGCNVDALNRLKQKGVSAQNIRKISGCSVKSLKVAGFNATDLLDAGFKESALKDAGFSNSDIESAALGLPAGLSIQDIKNTGCDIDKLRQLKAQGVSASVLTKLTSCPLRALREAGYTASDLLKAGMSPGMLSNAGFSSSDINRAKVNVPSALASLRVLGCSVDAINSAKAAGLSVSEIRKSAGCSASKLKAAGFSLKDLKEAGFTAAELKNIGATASDLRKAGFSANELNNAGFSAKELKNAGFTAKVLTEAGLPLDELAKAGFSLQTLKKAGASINDLKDAGISTKDIISQAGFTNKELKESGISNDSFMPGLDKVSELDKKKNSDKTVSKSKTNSSNDFLKGIESAASPENGKLSIIKANNAKLEQLLAKQQERLTSQRYQQKIQKAAAAMSGAASKAVSRWATVPSQAFTYMGEPQESAAAKLQREKEKGLTQAIDDEVIVKAGDIMFAVLDTSINSNEPGPIMARIVTGRFKGGKIIGSFSLPSNATKVILSFTQLSLNYAKKTVSINAVAIDPETARTAMASRVNNHYLLRYGSLFASSFLTGVGASVESSGNSISVSGTSVSVTEGLGRSTLQSAILGLAEVGKQWGTQAQKIFNTPPTVELFAGTGMGIMFTKDIKSIE